MFKQLPIELNYKIFDFYNPYLEEHKIHFNPTVNMIKSFPKFSRNVKIFIKRRMNVRYDYEFENKGVYSYFSKIENYKKTFMFVIENMKDKI